MFRGSLLARFILAIQFLTRIPIKIKLKVNPPDLGRSMIFYPAVGTLLGAILLLLNHYFGLVLSNLAVKALLVVSYIILTGGLHLDGYMDMIDGIFSGRSKVRILEIMHDSRVGAHGVSSLVSLILLKFVFLVELSGQIELEALLLMPTLGRWAMVYAAAFYPYARPNGGLGQAFSEYVGQREVVIASLWTSILTGLLLEIYGLITFLLIWVITVLIIRVITKRIDGLTGDCYGAISEIIEVVTLIILALLY
ncbi:MAG: adenosylcobinamide-GDP ribazoletransferase [Bacillota bacterium]